MLPEVTVTADVKVDRGQKSIYRVSPSVKYNLMAVPVTAIPRDVIKVNMPRIPCFEERAEISRRSPVQSDTPLPDPIKGIDRNSVENATHLVKEGETIEVLSRMYGVLVQDLKDINSSKLPVVGRYYNVFPEVYFDIDWRGRGYDNPGIGVIYDCETVLDIAVDFLIGGDGTCGARLQNMVVTGKAREQVQNWDEVQFLVANAKSSLIKQGCKAGDVADGENEKSKTISSLSDNILGNDANNTNGRALESTYQRYVWTIRLK